MRNQYRYCHIGFFCIRYICLGLKSRIVSGITWQSTLWVWSNVRDIINKALNMRTNYATVVSLTYRTHAGKVSEKGNLMQSLCKYIHCQIAFVNVHCIYIYFDKVQSKSFKYWCTKSFERMILHTPNYRFRSDLQINWFLKAWIYSRVLGIWLVKFARISHTKLFGVICLNETATFMFKFDAFVERIPKK